MGLMKGIINYFTPKDDTTPVISIGRNDLCWCGSGKKYKRCHLEEDGKKLGQARAASCCTTKT
jgi:uncharacterized protein YecA (UPF0149 family)